MDVYVDVVLAENFIINFFLLLITTQIIKMKGENKRLILSSSIGAVYTLLMFIPETTILVSLPAKLIMAAFMLFIVIGRRHPVLYFKSFICFILLSFLLCGLCFGIALFQNPYSFEANYTITSYLFKYVLFALMILYIITNRVVLFIKDRISISKFIYDIDIEYEGKCVSLRGFLDTGNSLTEPVTSLPVIIVEKAVLGNIEFDKDKCFYIPYKVINGFNDKLLGFKVDKIKIYKDNGESEYKEAIVCLCNTKLSNNREFEALLSRGVI